MKKQISNTVAREASGFYVTTTAFGIGAKDKCRITGMGQNTIFLGKNKKAQQQKISNVEMAKKYATRNAPLKT